MSSKQSKLHNNVCTSSFSLISYHHTNALFSSLGHPDIPIKAKPRECRRNIPLPFPSANFNFHPWIYSVQCIHSFTVHSVDRSNRNLFNFIRKNHAETVCFCFSLAQKRLLSRRFREQHKKSSLDFVVHRRPRLEKDDIPHTRRRKYWIGAACEWFRGSCLM